MFNFDRIVGILQRGHAIGAKIALLRKQCCAQGILHICIHPIKTRAIALLILYECAGRRVFLNVEHDITSAFQIEHCRHIDDLLVTLTQDFFQYAELFLRR